MSAFRHLYQHNETKIAPPTHRHLVVMSKWLSSIFFHCFYVHCPEIFCLCPCRLAKLSCPLSGKRQDKLLSRDKAIDITDCQYCVKCVKDMHWREVGCTILPGTEEFLDGRGPNKICTNIRFWLDIFDVCTVWSLFVLAQIYFLHCKRANWYCFLLILDDRNKKRWAQRNKRWTTSISFNFK